MPVAWLGRCCCTKQRTIWFPTPLLSAVDAKNIHFDACSLIDSCDRSLEKQPYCWLDGEPGQLARWGNSHGEGLKFCGRGQVGRFATSDSGTGSRVAARTSCSDLQKDHVCVFVTSMADKSYPSKWWNHRNLDWTCHWIKVELACNSSLEKIRYHHAASLWTCAGHRSSSISWRSAHRFWAVEMVRPLSCPMPFFQLFFLEIRLFSFDVQIWVWVSLINSVIRARDWPCLPTLIDSGAMMCQKMSLCYGKGTGAFRCWKHSWSDTMRAIQLMKYCQTPVFQSKPWFKKLRNVGTGNSDWLELESCKELASGCMQGLMAKGSLVHWFLKKNDILASYRQIYISRIPVPILMLSDFSAWWFSSNPKKCKMSVLSMSQTFPIRSASLKGLEPRFAAPWGMRVHTGHRRQQPSRCLERSENRAESDMIPPLTVE